MKNRADGKTGAFSQVLKTEPNDKHTTANIKKRAEQQQHHYKHQGSATGFAIVSIKCKNNLLKTRN